MHDKRHAPRGSRMFHHLPGLANSHSAPIVPKVRVAPEWPDLDCGAVTPIPGALDAQPSRRDEPGLRLVPWAASGIVGSSFGPATPPESSFDHIRFGPETAFYGGDSNSLYTCINLLLNFEIKRLTFSKLTIKQY